ncbi:MAG: efflux RND transporter periplasmic adaptor subunit [Candidatus Odinarchaeota archaeon]
MIKKALSISIGFTIIILLSYCSEKETTKEIIRPVRTEQVFSTGGERDRVFSGVVKSGSESKLSFKVPGTVKKVHVEIGSKVRAGQILAELDPVDYEIQVKQTENARDQARAAEIQAESQYNRIRTLYENRSASKSDYERARAAYESAHEQDNIAKKRRKLAQNQLEYTKLKAPVSGSISSVRIDENENVQAGMLTFILTSGSDLEVSIAIPEILIAQIHEGDNVTVNMEAVPGKSFKAKVTEVGVASSGYSMTYPVIVRLVETDPNIRPGMAAEVTFTFPATSERDCFIVPPIAVGEDRLGRFVYIVEPSDSGLGLIKKKHIEIGELTPDGLEIFEGLSDGDYLVTAGVSQIQDSLIVKF